MGLTKELPYSIFMKHLIFEITEKGQLYQLKKKWESKKPDCTPLRSTGKPLSMEKMSTAFILIVSGILLALFGFLLEIIFSLYVPKTPQKDADRLKLQICLDELKENRYARYPELLCLIKDVEKFLEQTSDKKCYDPECEVNKSKDNHSLNIMENEFEEELENINKSEKSELSSK